MERFRNRADAGRQLAGLLTEHAGRSDVIVLALPRGGVPVAFEVAAKLGVPLDVFLVRKLGVPGHEELALGAIAEGGVEVLNETLIADLGLSRAVVERVAVRERLELDRRDQLYRGDRRPPVVADRTVILIDDGLATGATMEAAIIAITRLKPARIVVAAPVGAKDTCERLGRLADRVRCLAMPEPFNAVGLWYEDFTQTTDAEVRQLLDAANRPARPDAPTSPTGDPIDLIRRRAHTIAGDAFDYYALLNVIGDARVVLLGEASHGTHEFYRERAAITKRLILEQGFSAVAVEADWPDAYRVNRYVRGVGSDGDSMEALGDFVRFPRWMWRNAEVLDFIGWLRTHNDGQRVDRRVGFYGLDLYSLHASMHAVIQYLAHVDPEAATRARHRYACFDRFGADPQGYAEGTSVGLGESCEREVIAQLQDLQKRAGEYARRDGRVAADDLFFAEQNARLVKNAEEYYRTMFGGRAESWNLRDRHMTDTLVELLQFLERTSPGPRVVVWAHNSHLGDARATEMGEHGELNVGQLARGRFGSAAVNVGFTTFTGTVTAASGWDMPATRMRVRPALAGSYERLFHEAGIPRFFLALRGDLELASALARPRLERAIGVIYAPATERRSHYFHARLSDQFDAVIHIDETRALEPIDRTAAWKAASADADETFPSGL
jgi:erythromycin esterase-like protein/predicted phosphoribosyltransferase